MLLDEDFDADEDFLYEDDEGEDEDDDDSEDAGESAPAAGGAKRYTYEQVMGMLHPASALPAVGGAVYGHPALAHAAMAGIHPAVAAAAMANPAAAAAGYYNHPLNANYYGGLHPAAAAGIVHPAFAPYANPYALAHPGSTIIPPVIKPGAVIPAQVIHPGAIITPILHPGMVGENLYPNGFGGITPHAGPGV